MSDEADRAEVPPADRLSTLWRRIKEHRIAQWMVGYVAVAYGIQHAVTLTSEAFDWPHAVTRVSMLLLALGLPVVITLAWYHGERASSRMSGAELTIITILIAMSSVLFYAFVRPSAEIATAPSEVQRAALATEGTTAKPSGVAAARSASLSPVTAISLAVLPFVNLSSDKEQEFFSDGMTEEITSALAKIPDLIVIGRTSAFQYKGKAEDLRAIGQALSAGYLIEGSVRKAGDRVRITAQLIRADTGAHLWADNYDRELKDVFAVQEDIAQAIAVALRVPLGLQQGESLVGSRTANEAVYEDYLRSRSLMRAESYPDAIKLLNQVVARDPAFAPGWALLAQAYAHLGLISGVQSGSIEEARRVAQSTLDKGEAAAREAIRLDPRNAIGYAALAKLQAKRGNRVAAEDLFKQALARDSYEPEVLENYCVQLSVTGRIREALNLCEKLRTLDPFVPRYTITAADVMQDAGQSKATIPILEAMHVSTLEEDIRNFLLARAYAAEGRFAEAADRLLLIRDSTEVSRREVEDAARLLRAAPAKIKAPEALPVLDNLDFVYLYVGAPDRVLDKLERKGAITSSFNGVVWSPLYAPLRRTDRFKAIVRNVGLVDYWRQGGWPDLCHPIGADDFVCN